MYCPMLYFQPMLDILCRFYSKNSKLMENYQDNLNIQTVVGDRRESSI